MNLNNFAQPSNYTAGSGELKLTELYLTSVNIPGITMNHPELGGRSGVHLIQGGDTLVYNSLSFELHIDEDFKIYHEFMDKIMNTVNPESGSYAPVEFDFWVNINNSKGHSLFKLEFFSCRIESIGDIQLDTKSDETELVLPVEIKYMYYKVNKDIAPALI